MVPIALTNEPMQSLEHWRFELLYPSPPRYIHSKLKQSFLLLSKIYSSQELMLYNVTMAAKEATVQITAAPVCRFSEPALAAAATTCFS
ncbi:hypothetical protein DL89DRAFT_266514 [Linderina pennispora]|uniref:Uncharacterized protein n=1 Tax=Linderina pennispora TaxID=61395 RepID=A0A1Y1WE32_9FUNG|nr:uncharacterized protein DL89DRAFT_266514 [Linderina pennispora]ORX71496.1 hypothetical protein DL89DRAFT_266514 [Linderina pennispora]